MVKDLAMLCTSNFNVVFFNPCSGYDAKLIRCVLGTTLNSLVIVQVIPVKLAMLALSDRWMRLCQVESPLQESV